MPDLQVIHGFHAVTSRMRQHAGAVREIFIDASRNDRRATDLAKLAESRNVRVMQVDAKRLDGMTGNAHHPKVALRAGFEFAEAEFCSGTSKSAGPIALDNTGKHAHLAMLHLTGQGIVR